MMNVDPRRALGRFFALALLLALPAAWGFGFDDVAARASSIAARPFKPAAVNLPTELRELDYDAYRDIRYRPEKALWRAEKLPFELMFFHQGRAVTEPVKINVIEPSGQTTSAGGPSRKACAVRRMCSSRFRP